MTQANGSVIRSEALTITKQPKKAAHVFGMKNYSATG